MRPSERSKGPLGAPFALDVPTGLLRQLESTGLRGMIA